MFYNARNAWTDARYQAQKTRVLKFGSTDYFRFLQDNPRAGRYLSLGKNVTFWNHRKWIRVEG